MSELKLRKEIPIEKTWAVEDIFTTDAWWEEHFLLLDSLLDEFEQFKGHLGDSPDVLYECLMREETLSEMLDKIYSYASCKMDVDIENTLYQGYLQRAQGLITRAAAATSFISTEVLAIHANELHTFCKEFPKLERFQRTIAVIRRKKAHTCSAEVEEVLAEAQEIGRASSNVFTVFNNADIRFPSITGEDGNAAEMTNARYISYMESRDRNVRKEAFHSMYSTFTQYRNVLATNYSNNIKQGAFFTKARKYSSTRAFYLSDSQIPEMVYDQLIEAVNEALPIMHRYLKLRRQLLDLNELHMYDIYAPLVKSVDMKVPYEEAQKIIRSALSPIGAQYLEVLDKGFNNRWIDYCENKGKRSGAYSNGIYGVHPYILMTYKERLDDVFTLAHEMGHAIHSYFSNSTQTYNNSQYRIFVAETASTCNEALLNHYLLEKAEDKSVRAYIINHYLESFRGTLFRQTMFAEFEKKTHAMHENGEALTADSICRVYKNLNEKYFGSETVLDKGIEMEWARIPHFYRPFYVYQYATGFSAAIALSKRILNEGEEASADYIKFLKSGCTKDPIELLKDAGVDMNEKTPVRNAIAVFEELLSELELCLKNMKN